MEINIASNVNDVMRRVSDIRRRQVPFALSQAMNTTAFEIRTEIVQRTFPRSFTVRNSRFISAVLRVDKANKTNLTASVFDGLGRDYLEKNTEGGTKSPLGNHLALPGRQLGSSIRTAGGAVRKAFKPRTILDKPRTFIQTLRSGDKAIVERPAGTTAGKRKDKVQMRGPLKVWYLLIPRATIKDRFPFYEEAKRKVKEELPVAWKKAWDRAISTARK